MQRNLNQIRESNISYLKNNNFKYIENEEIRLASEKKHDGYDLLFETLLHTRHRVNNKSINWLCKDSKGKESNGCPGSITVSSDDLILKFTEHDLDLSHHPHNISILII